MKNILTDLPKPFMVLAPMDDVTETVFRQIVAGCAVPDLFFTEFVNVDALQSAGRESAMKRLIITDTEQPLIAQIWGKNPENFYKTARQIVDGTIIKEATGLRSKSRDVEQGEDEKRSKAYGSVRRASIADHDTAMHSGLYFAGVDINMGCPDKKVVRNGTGGGMIKIPDEARAVIQATKDGLAGKLPLSVKTRIGFKEYDEAWIRFLLEQDLDMLSIHFRTVKEMSKVPAHWELAGKIKELRDQISPTTLLVGNGDVLDYSQAQDLAQKYGYDGIMIGRGIFHDPYVFAKESPWANLEPAQKIDLYIKHLELFQATYPDRQRSFDTIKKFCKIYINNFAGAGELRAKLMTAKTVEESLDLLQN